VVESGGAHDAALEDAASRLARAGARVREVTMPEKFDAFSDARARIGDFESSRALAWERRHSRRRSARR
jgi:Asp-tRNA(Asn)/Glu-tRNA(Gln) amidotransferase A subunit family amidase